MLPSTFVAFILLGCAVIANAHAVEHIVAVMLENRAFDHMCGRLGKGVNGVTGKEFNALLNGTRFYTRPGAPYVNPFDPDHSFDATTLELFNAPFEKVPAPMSGFVQRHFNDSDPQFWTVMDGFTPSAVPSISTLAQEFAVFDEWFASLPGPTYPNRLFWHSGTSHGMTDNSLSAYLPGMPQRTVYDVLNDHNVSWASYYTDISDLILFKSMRSIRNLERYHPIDQFIKDAAAGTLPTLSWVQPRFFPSLWGAAEDEHPDHDVAMGERFIAKVYSALRNSPLWNKSMMVVSYDEHGGFWDHVPPPPHVPSPDGLIDKKTGFNFTRLGVRVCTVVASPYIPRGTVVHGPPEQGRHYEHSSFYATLRDVLHIGEQLSNRTINAYPFTDIMSLSAPRADCPTKLPTPSQSSEAMAERLLEELQRSPNGLQKDLFGLLQATMGTEVTSGAEHKTQHEMGSAVRQMMGALLKREPDVARVR